MFLPRQLPVVLLEGSFQFSERSFQFWPIKSVIVFFLNMPCVLDPWLD